jgi:hypothetical protein
LFVPASLLAAYLLWVESRPKSKKHKTSIYWIWLVIVTGILYFFLLWNEGTRFSVFSSLDTHSKQHLFLAVSLVISGIISFIYRGKENIWKILRIFFIFELASIALFHVDRHTHVEGLAQATWLRPYHRLIATLLLIAGVTLLFEALPRFHKHKRKLLIIAAAAFVGVGILLASYRNPYSYGEPVIIEPCNIPGRTVKVEISEKAINPSILNTYRCDTLIFVALDDEPHLIAFGKHDHHNQYPGYQEQPIIEGKDLRLRLSKTGTFKIHDHDNADVNAVLIVN